MNKKKERNNKRIAALTSIILCIGAGGEQHCDTFKEKETGL